MKVETQNIPNSKLERNHVTRNGNTQDIINSVLRMDKKAGSEFCQFSQQFSNGIEGLKKLWNFTRHEIKYKADKKQQIIKAPAALYKIKQGDCKSKTLFINAVLRCLDIPYIIRFTNYKPGQKEVKHVYTVALINGKELPIDSVYSMFGVEKPYNLKIDYPMAEITEITGLDFQQATRKLTAEQQLQLKELQTPRQTNDVCSLYAGANVAKLEELRQKKESIKAPEPIAFNKVTEAVARLEIAKRQLDILKVMQPEKMPLIKIGEKLINRALKGNYSLTGTIPNELSNLCTTIKHAAGLQMKANSWGAQAQITAAKLRNAQGDHRPCHTVGNLTFPNRYCLANQVWAQQNFLPTNLDIQNSTFIADLQNSFTPLPATNANAHWGVCDAADYAPLMAMPLSTYVAGGGGGSGVVTDANGLTWGDIVKFYYGRDSIFGSTYAQDGEYLESVLQAYDGQLFGGLDGTYGGTRTGMWSAYFSSQNNYEATLDVLKEECSTMSNFINDIFRADQTSANGTLGSGLFYHFADAIQFGGTGINPNDLPPSVITKQTFQNSFLDSCNIFAGVSQANLSGLTRNGVLFDTGEQPEPTLDYLYSIYRTGNIPGGQGIQGAQIGEPISAIIAAVAAAIVAIVAAVAAAVAEGEKATTQAPLIDQSLNDTANFQPLTPSTMAGDNDWLPVFGGGGSGGTGGAGSNTGLILGAAALGLGAFALTRNKKKKKKK